MNDAQAITRLKRGDISGLEWLVRAYQAQAQRIAFLIVHDQKIGEDIVQSAFIKAYERIHQFDSHRSFAPWFFKIVSNDAIKAINHHKNRVSLEAEELDDQAPIDWLSASLSLPEVLLEQTETSEELWGLLQKLSPGQRAVLVLRYYADYTSIEIANDLDISPGTVRWRVHAALKRLRGLMKFSEGSRTLNPLGSKNRSGEKEREV
jgi:RNA polymerase sigma-70 factor (ECF subfamily)